MSLPEGLSRTERRKANTRAALIRAGQKFLAEGRTNVSVLDITSTADVGNGSFYNHFSTKDELFDASVDAVLEAHGALMDDLTSDIDDPAEAFTQSFRLTGRLHRRHPEATLVTLQRGTQVLTSEHGLVPRATRDITAAVKAGRFEVDDIDTAMAVVVGASLALGQLLLSRPDRDDAATTDAVTRQILRGLGLSDRDAAELCSLPLPDID
ncbi:TetR/AcrR family transcriptional regulator [Gordonia sp. VNQ95]|uniref:TetR/AcrR family transcriptional regulator n=1 Tax=Gordonia sp. VNQ95 TaxID=3156619 RepID=UPI0032B510F2